MAHTYETLRPTLMALVTQNEYLESIWLTGLASIEDLAAQQITRNIAAETPTDEIRNIVKHAQDELRHASEFRAMRPKLSYPSLRYYRFQERVLSFFKDFIMGFFANPVLNKAKHRHAAYVHGAMTIERFPYQLYTTYVKATSLTAVKNRLPSVIKDEKGHLELGHRMRKDLTPDEQLPVEALERIEDDMCATLFQRLIDEYNAFLDAQGSES